MSRMTRILILFVLLSALALPGTAQASVAKGVPSLNLPDVLSWFWEGMAQWLGTADSNLEKGRGQLDPNGTPTAPEGDSSYTDGRGACDPNGVAVE